MASLFDSLCERNAVTHNPVRGVKRPRVNSNEGKTPALSDGQARALLEAPSPETLKGKRDRAILATFLHHGLRCEELCKLAVRDIDDRQGVAQFRVHGKGSKIRHIPLHPIALQRIQEYLIAAGHAEDTAGPLFRPVKNPSENGDISHALTHPAIYHCVLRKYAHAIGIGGGHLGPHSLRATAATNALERGSDLAEVQEWLGHANVATTRLYDRRRSRPRQSHLPHFVLDHSEIYSDTSRPRRTLRLRKARTFTKSAFYHTCDSNLPSYSWRVYSRDR